ncbi:MAG TPA: DUF5684 domain-containing protein [Bryobacteraceae bacterium]|nr:DUF5684 domain-containing protein [Bryobacteraceae bacterium]
MNSGDGGANLLGGGISVVMAMLVMAVMIASMWKVFVKAGQPGWAAVVPVYNFVVLLKIVGKPLWWIALFFVPLANFVVMILVAIELAKNFGKSTGFGIGLAFLGFIFYPILGFGGAQYLGPGVTGQPVLAAI